MEKQAYIDQATPTDGLRSLQGELLRSRDYGDERIYPDTDVLVEAGRYWSKELDSDQRSLRAKTDIERIISRIAFEIVQRGEVI
jgi:hypothetical protein